jgi:hypothetical protein
LAAANTVSAPVFSRITRSGTRLIIMLCDHCCSSAPSFFPPRGRGAGDQCSAPAID